MEEEYKENFRVYRENFDKLCDELRPYIKRRNTRMRSSVPVDTHVAVTLYYLVMKDVSGKQQTRSVWHLAPVLEVFVLPRQWNMDLLIRQQRSSQLLRDPLL